MPDAVCRSGLLSRLPPRPPPGILRATGLNGSPPEVPGVCSVAFLLRAACWIGLHLVALVAGAFVGGAMTPKVNPHNDWGVTGMLYSLTGALIGSSGVIVLLMWW